jgi:ribosomal protein L7Ae-like RNA K-turn-binding protein
VEKEKFLSLLGLCKRSGNVIAGTPLVTKSLPQGKISLVFYSSASSPNTEKKISDKTAFYGVESIKIDISAEEIAHAIGKSGSVTSVGITNEHFSKQLKILTSNEKR